MLAVIAVVFHQIFTEMTEAGIARGGPFQNAAAYPKTIAAIIGILLIVQMIGRFVGSGSSDVSEHGLGARVLVRPALLIVVFALYLGLLKILGYHLSTAPFLCSVMVIAGERQWSRLVPISIVFAFSLAFVFEVLLNIVLPGGIFRLNIPW